MDWSKWRGWSRRVRAGTCGVSPSAGRRGARVLRAGLLGTVVLGVVLAGCTPSPAAAPSVSATPTMPAPMSSPAKPAAWSDNGEDGARAAAVWFVRDLYRYVLETNDVADWQALSAPGCAFCTKAAGHARSDASEGKVLRFGSFTVSVTSSTELDPLSYAVVAQVEQGRTTMLSLDGEVRGTGDPLKGHLYLVLFREGPDWHLGEGQWFDANQAVPTAVPTP